MSIDSVLVGQDSAHYTEQRPILRGVFNISRAAIPFFQGAMRLDEATKELSLVENLPADLRAKWRLEELFQREIDWDRVETEIVRNYLRRPEKLQFFNSLTVALLPLDQSRLLAKSYGDAVGAPPVPESQRSDPWVTSNIGGVQLVTNARTPHGYIRWNPKLVFPATIDGQHRLAALQRLVQDAGHLTVANLETTISVIFLVLDERVGLRLDPQHANQENPILGVVREVFIDLNKHAREVNRARQILLDDQQIESRCVRKLLAQRIGEEEPGTLPLGLVHWQHKVTAKFNAGDSTAPFITTVELLNSIVTDILDIKYPRDPFDEGQVRKFVNRVEDSLSVSRVVSDNPVQYQGLPSLTKYVEDNYLSDDSGEPFANLPPLYLRAADAGFVRNWRPLIVGVLTRFKPYRNFIAEVRRRGGIDGDLAFYLTLPTKAQAQKRAEWGDRRSILIDTPQRQLAEMKERDWPFFAVFQKGLFTATAEAWRHAMSTDVSEEATTLPAAQEAFLSRWIAFMDKVYDAGLLEVKAQSAGLTPPEVWSGIALNPGSKTVKWTSSAADRISDLLLSWWYLRTKGHRDVDSFLKLVESKVSDKTHPGVRKAVESLTKALLSPIDAAFPDELDEDEQKKRVDARLRQLLELAPKA